MLNLSRAPYSLSSIFPGAGSEERLGTLLSGAPEDLALEAMGKREKQLPQEGPILSLEQAYILRAAAVDACEIMVEYAHTMELSELQAQDLVWVREIQLPDLDTWLWAVAKDRKDYRSLQRFALRNTPFF